MNVVSWLWGLSFLSPPFNQVLKANSPANSYLQGGDTHILQKISEKGKKRAFVTSTQFCSPL